VAGGPAAPAVPSGERFGPEYEPTVRQRGDRKAAEAELKDRARRHDRLGLVDEPGLHGLPLRPVLITIPGAERPELERAIDDADALLDRVMRDRGYPVDDFEEKAELVSVDHPQVVEDYRAARAAQERNAERMASTEELRHALLRYRALFDELLEHGATTPSDSKSYEVGLVSSSTQPSPSAVASAPSVTPTPPQCQHPHRW
jgi:hypothetical protein